MDIANIDKNFEIKAVLKREGFKFYNIEEAPFRIYGIKLENGMYRRMPEDVAKSVSEGVYFLHTNTAGGRVRFATDSKSVCICAEYNGVGKMSHFAFTGSVGFDLYTGKTGKKQKYSGTFVPPADIKDDSVFESQLDLDGDGILEMTLNLPLYSNVKALYIGLKEDAKLFPAGDYRTEKPIVFYGSSITQGACASRPGNCYQAILSRELDFNYINLGFSGSARGEKEMAEYIAGLDMSAFVYDYDYNAHSADHLLNTHKALFMKVRERHPDIPVLILSRPKYYLNNDEKERLDVIRKTYDEAVASGDKNVYLFTGPELITEEFCETALVDNCHPTDSGFLSMSKALYGTLKKVL